MTDAAEPQQTEVPEAEAPKGRPTPKRSEAEAQRKALAKPATSRKEAAKRQRETRKAQLAKQREALATGDERYLPARDRGQVRRFVRDFVDSKWAVAEFFLPFAVVILVMSMLPSMALTNLSLLLWLALIFLIIVDSVATSIRLKKQLQERFPDERKKGAVAYALMRTLQMRRMRLPKPQVARGQKP